MMGYPDNTMTIVELAPEQVAQLSAAITDNVWAGRPPAVRIAVEVKPGAAGPAFDGTVAGTLKLKLDEGVWSPPLGEVRVRMERLYS